MKTYYTIYILVMMSYNVITNTNGAKLTACKVGDRTVLVSRAKRAFLTSRNYCRQHLMELARFDTNDDASSLNSSRCIPEEFWIGFNSNRNYGVKDLGVGGGGGGVRLAFTADLDSERYFICARQEHPYDAVMLLVVTCLIILFTFLVLLIIASVFWIGVKRGSVRPRASDADQHNNGISLKSFSRLTSVTRHYHDNDTSSSRCDVIQVDETSGLKAPPPASNVYELS